MLYHRPEDSSTPGKSVLPHKQFNVLAIYTGINDDYILLQVKRPNQQYQSTEGDATKEKAKNENN